MCLKKPNKLRVWKTLAELELSKQKAKMKCKRFVSIPVFSVFLVLGFVYYTTVFVYIDEWVDLHSSAGTLNAVIFTFVAYLCLFSFLASLLIDPGHVPSSYVPDLEDSDDGPHKNKSQSRQCDKCHQYKPPRAHHCRVCRRCVLRMDHHCLWINNCVGYRNYKAFFILVLYATTASIYSSVIFVCCIVQKDLDFQRRTHLKVFYVTSGTLVFGLSITLGSLLGWHIYLMTHNMTTIEHYQVRRAAWLARKSGQIYCHRFDLSAYRNITMVLGPNMLKWFCPTAVGHLKDGMSFPTSHDS